MSLLPSIRSHVSARRLPAGTALLVAVALVAGCGGNGAEDPDTGQQTVPTIMDGPVADEAAPEEPVVAPTPEEPAAPVYPVSTGSTVLTDVDGYTLRADFVYRPRTYEKDIAVEKPGFSSIRVTQATDLTLTNTTPGRAVSIGGLAQGDSVLYLLATWNAGSTLCTAMGVTTTCAISLANTQLPGSLDAAGSTAGVGVVYAGRSGADAGVSGVPDASYDAVLAALQAPDGYVLAYAGGDNQRFEQACPDPDLTAYLDDHWVVNYVTYGTFNSGFFPIWSSTGQCGTFQVLAQPVVS